MIPFDLRMRHDAYGNAADLLSAEDASRLKDGRWRRASGDVICESCGMLYYDHPLVIGALWLHRICDGDLVHL